MICERVNVGGVTAIVCSSRRRRRKCACGAYADYQCDWKVRRSEASADRDGKTCDAYICGACALQPAPEKHLCPEHQAAYREWLAKRRAAATA